MNTGRLCQTLGEIDLTRVDSDVELFRWIKRRYRSLRGASLRRRFSQPSSIRFVYFGLEQINKVHILHKDDSFPPEDEVSAQRWHLSPSPPRPKGSLPMPSDTFIHYLRYCNLDTETPHAQKIWLEKLPKKLNGAILQRNRHPPVLVEAWGVLVNESLNLELFIWASMLVTVGIIAPVLTAIILRTHDIQSAFAIVGLPLTVTIALLGAWMQYEKGKYA